MKRAHLWESVGPRVRLYVEEENRDHERKHQHLRGEARSSQTPQAATNTWLCLCPPPPPPAAPFSILGQHNAIGASRLVGAGESGDLAAADRRQPEPSLSH